MRKVSEMRHPCSRPATFCFGDGFVYFTALEAPSLNSLGDQVQSGETFDSMKHHSPPFLDGIVAGEPYHTSEKYTLLRIFPDPVYCP